MKTFMRLIVTLFLILSVNYCNFGQQKTERFDLNKLDKYIEKARTDWKIPGLAIAIVYNDSVIFAKGYGVKDFSKPDKVDVNTVFAIASNTKAFTSAALAVLVDQGKLKWDDRVVDYLPYFQLYDPYVTQNMTVRDLLCHRSGLKTFSGDLVWYGTTYSRKDVIMRARELKPAYGFRSRYGYSNIMYLTAGEIIPVITGKSWEQFILQTFLQPLGMNNTYISIKDFTSKTNLAIPHNVIISDNKTETINYLNWDNIAPAGSLNSCVADLSKWLKFQLNNGKINGKQIISDDRFWEMRSPQTIENFSQGAASLWSTTHFKAYGLGWGLMDYNGRKVVEHGGGADGMISKTVLVPEENLGFVILTNSINYLPDALAWHILDEYFKNPEKDWSKLFLEYFLMDEKEKKENTDKLINACVKGSKPSLAIENYTGRYTSKLYGDVNVILQNNNLVVDFVPTPMFIGDLMHYKLETFVIRLRNFPSLPPGTAHFILNEKAKVTGLRIDIPNPDFDFTELDFIKANE